MCRRWWPIWRCLLFSAVGGLIPGTLFGVSVRLAPDDDTVSTTVGWMQQLSALGQFIGPPAVAWLASTVGNWHWTGIATGACSLLGLWVAARVQGAWVGVHAVAGNFAPKWLFSKTMKSYRHCFQHMLLALLFGIPVGCLTGGPFVSCHLLD